MNKNNTNKKKKGQDKMLCEDAYFRNPVASATDCTGITQRIPEYESEAESYSDIYDVPVTSLDGGEADADIR